jgi:hypothetical protein
MGAFGERTAQALFAALGASGALTTVQYVSRLAPVTDLETGTILSASSTRSSQMRLREFRRQEVDGVTVMQGDRQALLPVLTFQGTPTTMDVLDIAGQRYEVRGVGKSANEGLWTWQLRQVGVT